MRVVVAEDVMLTRVGIVRSLADAGREVVGEAEDLDGLIVADIRMPPTHTDEGIVTA